MFLSDFGVLQVLYYLSSPSLCIQCYLKSESILSKRPVWRFTVAKFVLLKLFSSRINCIPKLKCYIIMCAALLMRFTEPNFCSFHPLQFYVFVYNRFFKTISPRRLSKKHIFLHIKQGRPTASRLGYSASGNALGRPSA